jgi:hypothetical protein
MARSCSNPFHQIFLCFARRSTGRYCFNWHLLRLIGVFFGKTGGVAQRVLALFKPSSHLGVRGVMASIGEGRVGRSIALLKHVTNYHRLLVLANT